MLTWELALRVRRAACEFKLAGLRERHSRVVDERRRCPEMGPSWRKKDDVLAAIQREIRQQLSEIRFIKKMANCGPIVGNKMVLHVRDGVTHKVRPGPSIIDIIQRERDRAEFVYENSGDPEIKGKVAGIDLALEILYNPYRFLDEDERAAYDRAEADQDKIIANRAGGAPKTQRILPAGQPAPTLAQVKAMSSDKNVVVRRGNRRS